MHGRWEGEWGRREGGAGGGRGFCAGPAPARVFIYAGIGTALTSHHSAPPSSTSQLLLSFPSSCHCCCYLSLHTTHHFLLPSLPTSRSALPRSSRHLHLHHLISIFSASIIVPSVINTTVSSSNSPPLDCSQPSAAAAVFVFAALRSCKCHLVL